MLPAVVMALGIHGLLLGMEFNWLNRTPPPKPKPRAVTMTLTYLKPQKQSPKPKPAVQQPVVAPQKPLPLVKPIEKPKPKRVFRPKPKPKSLKYKTKNIKIFTKKKVPPAPKLPIAPEAPEKAKDRKPVPFEDRMPLEASKTTKPATQVRFVQKPRPLQRRNPPPNYPMFARRKGYQGIVVLEVRIDRKGSVSQVKVFRSSQYPVLDKAAIKAVKNWSFEPGKKEGTPVDMWVTIPIRFRLK